MGDELLVAPLSLFYPDLMKLSGPKFITLQRSGTGDPDDPFDDLYLRDTSRRGGREVTEAMDVTGGDGPEGGDEDIVVDDHPLQTSSSQQSRDHSSSGLSSTSPLLDKVLSLEQAILSSIDRCGKYLTIISYVND